MCNLKHRVEHCIPTSGLPTQCQLSPNKLAITPHKFATMEKLGIVRRSSSLWASPLYMVEKKLQLLGAHVEITVG